MHQGYLNRNTNTFQLYCMELKTIEDVKATQFIICLIQGVSSFLLLGSSKKDETPCMLATKVAQYLGQLKRHADFNFDTQESQSTKWGTLHCLVLMI